MTEPGSSWWPVLWGPAFASMGASVEAVSGSVHGLAWLLLGVALAGGAAVRVNARRRCMFRPEANQYFAAGRPSPTYRP